MSNKLFQRSFFFAILFLAFCFSLKANILGEALLSFPDGTEYFEYDNLTELRRLPSYPELRKNFSGPALEEARSVLGALGIPEEQVQEVITGEGTSNEFFGLLSGTFSARLATAGLKARRYGAKLLDTEVYCVGRGTCVVFLEDSLAAFGSVARLKNMLEVRRGILLRLSANRNAVRLIDTTDRNAQVRGMLLGARLQSTITSALKEWSGRSLKPSELGVSVRAMSYSVHFDTEAHVSAAVECESATQASLLSHTLGALSTLQTLASPVMSGVAGLGLEHVKSSSSGDMVYLQADRSIKALISNTP